MQYRNEYKHFVNKFESIILKSKLSMLLKKDENTDAEGKYFIRSLYFDTYDDKALYEKLDGVWFRHKFRIRAYNHDDSYIKLEKKIKHVGSTAKVVASLSRDEVESIIKKDYDFLKTSNDPLKYEFYTELTANGLIPKIVVDYIRYAFVYEAGNVRITVDTDLRAPLGLVDMFDTNVPTVSVFPDERSIIEVKYDEFLPDFIRKLIGTDNRSSSSVSKYAACRHFL